MNEDTGVREIATSRLDLRPIRSTDSAGLLLVFRDPEVRRYLLDDTLVSPEWVEAEIDASQRAFDEEGWGIWAIRKLGDDRIRGFVGFREFFDPPERQLLYGLLPESWGLGYASEAGAAVLAYAFEVLRVESVVAATDAPNVRSIAVMKRLGMTFQRRTEDGVYGTEFYECRRADIAARRGTAS